MFLHTTPNNLNHGIAGTALAMGVDSDAFGMPIGMPIGMGSAEPSDDATDCRMVWEKTQIQTVVMACRPNVDLEVERYMDADSSLDSGIVAQNPRTPNLRSHSLRPRFEPASRG